MYFSENGQDQWLEENVFRGKRNGVALEAGALDGLLHSNTLFFERERGFQCILVEANPKMRSLLRANRPAAQVVECALASVERKAEFAVVDGPLFGWSALTATIDAQRRNAYAGLDGEFVQVECRTLASVLTECGVRRVDYLSLDVEGAEFDVLRDFPFDQFEIDILGVEQNLGCDNSVRQLMTNWGYRYLKRVGVDEFWERGHG